MRLCNRPSRVHGAEGCPRPHGHRGEHWWWIPFEVGEGWRAIVYAGEAAERRRIARGIFTAMPSGQDVHRLLRTLGTVYAQPNGGTSHA